VKLTSREKKMVFAGIAVAAAVAIFYAATSLLPSGEDLSKAVELKKKTVLKQREILGQEEFYKERVEQFARRLEEDRTRLLPGNNANLAGAELQKLLKEFADQNGVEITQKSTLQEKKIQDTLSRVAVRIETNCNPDQLVGFLAAIENHPKQLAVEEMAINGYRIQRRFEIRPILTVVGYISSPKPEEKPAGGPATGSPPAAGQKVSGR